MQHFSAPVMWAQIDGNMHMRHSAYADFATQICQVSGRSRLTKQDMEDASNNLIHIILKGCGIKPSA